MPKFAGELLHFNAVRMRVTGAGNLDLTLNSLDSVNSEALTAIPMSATTNQEPTVLANYRDQCGQLIVQTDAIDETFSVSRIVIFIKPLASGYPL